MVINRSIVACFRIGDIVGVPHDPKTFAERLIKERNDRGLTQGALADLAGLTQGYISQLEKGDVKEPGASAVRELERALNVYYGYLLEPESVRAERRAAVDRLVLEHGGELGITDDEAHEMSTCINFMLPGQGPSTTYLIKVLDLWRMAKAAKRKQ